ncbi:uncharacterized protein LOC141835278 [Curcuma longa]|uniref:uncharacterized protein LOC141835278 n=1 Tax=Curcuma longa TaxID=136217 RepID=UPI003D9E8FBC
MESTRAGKRLWHIVRAVFYMIRQGLSKDKLMMDLHLLRKRGKLIGKALGNLMTFHHHHGRHHHQHHHHRHQGNSLLNSVSLYSPKEVAFSHSTSPAYPSYDNSYHRGHRHHCDYEAMAFAEELEMLNSEEDYAESSDMASSLSPTRRLWSFDKSPVAVRQLRVTDSPFPLKDEEEADSHIDEEAEQFIKRFYEQLRLQQRITPMTPEYKHCRNEGLVGRA